MRIGVVAPARPIDPVVAARAGAFAAIAYPEVDLVFHPQCFEHDGLIRRAKEFPCVTCTP
jgi:muramoyltetrapeptide carboxypeptidase